MTSLSGIIREDMTFGSGDAVSLSGNVQIASGYTVTFGPGSSLTGNGQGTSKQIEVFGSLVISGTSTNLIEVEDIKIYGKEGGSTSINYSHVFHSVPNSSATRIYPTFNNSGSLNISNSVIEIYGTKIDLNSTSVIKGNIFNNTQIDADQKETITLDSNTFIGTSSIDTKSDHGFFSTPLLKLKDNNFLSSTSQSLTLNDFWDYNHIVTTTGNYWSTDDVSVIQEKITDGNDNLNINGVVDLSNRASTYTKAPLALGEYKVNLSSMKLVTNPKVIDADGNLWDSTIDVGDGTSILPAAAQTYRSYFGALGRLPDEGGYNWWLGEIEAGRHTLNSMAAGFIDSSEFKALSDSDNSGVISNEEFILHMYNGVFGRDPDAGGLAWWVGQLDTEAKTQPDAFISMTQSNEYVELTVGTVADMMFY
jgi:hypothetical protein